MPRFASDKMEKKKDTRYGTSQYWGKNEKKITKSCIVLGILTGMKQYENM